LLDSLLQEIVSIKEEIRHKIRQQVKCFLYSSIRALIYKPHLIICT